MHGIVHYKFKRNHHVLKMEIQTFCDVDLPSKLYITCTVILRKIIKKSLLIGFKDRPKFRKSSLFLHADSNKKLYIICLAMT